MPDGIGHLRATRDVHDDGVFCIAVWTRLGVVARAPLQGCGPRRVRQHNPRRDHVSAFAHHAASDCSLETGMWQSRRVRGMLKARETHTIQCGDEGPSGARRRILVVTPVPQRRLAVAHDFVGGAGRGGGGGRPPATFRAGRPTTRACRRGSRRMRRCGRCLSGSVCARAVHTKAVAVSR